MVESFLTSSVIISTCQQKWWSHCYLCFIFMVSNLYNYLLLLFIILVLSFIKLLLRFWALLILYSVINYLYCICYLYIVLLLLLLVCWRLYCFARCTQLANALFLRAKLISHLLSSRCLYNILQLDTLSSSFFILHLMSSIQLWYLCTRLLFSTIRRN